MLLREYYVQLTGLAEEVLEVLPTDVEGKLEQSQH